MSVLSKISLDYLEIIEHSYQVYINNSNVDLYDFIHLYSTDDIRYLNKSIYNIIERLNNDRYLNNRFPLYDFKDMSLNGDDLYKNMIDEKMNKLIEEINTNSSLKRRSFSLFSKHDPFSFKEELTRHRLLHYPQIFEKTERSTKNLNHLRFLETFKERYSSLDSEELNIFRQNVNINDLSKMLDDYKDDSEPISDKIDGIINPNIKQVSFDDKTLDLDAINSQVFSDDKTLDLNAIESHLMT